jgi:hypothetical protein
VSIRIGLAQAKPGDSIASFIEAADHGMCADKRAMKAAERHPGTGGE